MLLCECWRLGCCCCGCCCCEYLDCDAAGNVVKVLVLCTQMLRVWLTYDVADAGANVLYANAGV